MWHDDFISYLEIVSGRRSKTPHEDESLRLILVYLGILKETKIIKTEEDAKSALSPLGKPLEVDKAFMDAWAKTNYRDFEKFKEEYNGNNSRNT